MRTVIEWFPISEIPKFDDNDKEYLIIMPCYHDHRLFSITNAVRTNGYWVVTREYGDCEVTDALFWAEYSNFKDQM